MNRIKAYCISFFILALVLTAIADKNSPTETSSAQKKTLAQLLVQKGSDIQNTETPIEEKGETSPKEVTETSSTEINEVSPAEEKNEKYLEYKADKKILRLSMPVTIFHDVDSYELSPQKNYLLLHQKDASWSVKRLLTFAQALWSPKQVDFVEKSMEYKKITKLIDMKSGEEITSFENIIMYEFSPNEERLLVSLSVKTINTILGLEKPNTKHKIKNIGEKIEKTTKSNEFFQYQLFDINSKKIIKHFENVQQVEFENDALLNIKYEDGTDKSLQIGPKTSSSRFNRFMNLINPNYAPIKPKTTQQIVFRKPILYNFEKRELRITLPNKTTIPFAPILTYQFSPGRNYLIVTSPEVIKTKREVIGNLFQKIYRTIKEGVSTEVLLGKDIITSLIDLKTGKKIIIHSSVITYEFNQIEDKLLILELTSTTTSQYYCFDIKSQKKIKTFGLQKIASFATNTTFNVYEEHQPTAKEELKLPKIIEKIQNLAGNVTAPIASAAEAVAETVVSSAQEVIGEETIQQAYEAVAPLMRKFGELISPKPTKEQIKEQQFKEEEIIAQQKTQTKKEEIIAPLLQGDDTTVINYIKKYNNKKITDKNNFITSFFAGSNASLSEGIEVNDYTKGANFDIDITPGFLYITDKAGKTISTYKLDSDPQVIASNKDESYIAIGYIDKKGIDIFVRSENNTFSPYPIPKLEDFSFIKGLQFIDATNKTYLFFIDSKDKLGAIKLSKENAPVILTSSPGIMAKAQEMTGAISKSIEEKATKVYTGAQDVYAGAQKTISSGIEGAKNILTKTTKTPMPATQITASEQPQYLATTPQTASQRQETLEPLEEEFTEPEDVKSYMQEFENTKEETLIDEIITDLINYDDEYDRSALIKQYNKYNPDTKKAFALLFFAKPNNIPNSNLTADGVNDILYVSDKEIDQQTGKATNKIIFTSSEIDTPLMGYKFIKTAAENIYLFYLDADNTMHVVNIPQTKPAVAEKQTPLEPTNTAELAKAQSLLTEIKAISDQLPQTTTTPQEIEEISSPATIEEHLQEIIEASKQLDNITVQLPHQMRKSLQNQQEIIATQYKEIYHDAITTVVESQLAQNETTLLQTVAPVATTAMAGAMVGLVTQAVAQTGNLSALEINYIDLGSRAGENALIAVVQELTQKQIGAAPAAVLAGGVANAVMQSINTGTISATGAITAGLINEACAIAADVVAKHGGAAGLASKIDWPAIALRKSNSLAVIKVEEMVLPKMEEIITNKTVTSLLMDVGGKALQSGVIGGLFSITLTSMGLIGPEDLLTAVTQGVLTGLIAASTAEITGKEGGVITTSSKALVAIASTLSQGANIIISPQNVLQGIGEAAVQTIIPALINKEVVFTVAQDIGEVTATRWLPALGSLTKVVEKITKGLETLTTTITPNLDIGTAPQVAH